MSGASFKRIVTLAWITASTLAATTATASHAIAAAKDTVTLALATEPPQLNSTKATDNDSFFILGHVMEGRTRRGKDGKPTPGVAERWELSDKGATFFLRKNAKWNDGKPVTAHDFVHAWRTVVDPKNASEYAFILYPIKNAEAINTRKAKLSDLGAIAADDHTLKITFEKPCGHFLSLTSFALYYPVREDFHKARGDKYGANVQDLVYNGPFMLTKWVHGASLRMEKNPHYWNSANTHLAAIDVPYITPDDSARFNLFKDRKTDLVLTLNRDLLPLAQRERFKLKRFDDGTLFFMEFNFRDGRITRNKSLRKAIEAAFDRDEYVTKVVGIPGTRPGQGLIPGWMNGKNTLFRREYPVAKTRANPALARKLMQDALKELKLQKIPALTWLTGDSPLAGREAEYFQSVFKNVLGIELRIDKQIFKQRLAKMTSGDFDIVSAGWGPDYNDAMTFADLMSSWNENNRGQWKNAKYDELIRKAMNTTDQKVRMDSMAAAEKIALEELAVLPLYERIVVYTHSDRLDGVVRRAVGFDPDLSGARIVTESGK